MLVKVFEIKKSDIFNKYVAEYHNVKQLTEVGLECEIITEKNERIRWRTDLYGLQVEAWGDKRKMTKV